MLDAALDPGLVALDADHDTVVHGHRERLGTAHAAEPGGHGDGAGQVPPNRLSATAANVSNVPWRIPWVPM